MQKFIRKTLQFRKNKTKLTSILKWLILSPRMITELLSWLRIFLRNCNLS